MLEECLPWRQERSSEPNNKSDGRPRKPASGQDVTRAAKLGKTGEGEESCTAFTKDHTSGGHVGDRLAPKDQAKLANESSNDRPELGVDLGVILRELSKAVGGDEIELFPIKVRNLQALVSSE